MKKKLQLLATATFLLLTVKMSADTIVNSDLNLYNPDVRKCLLDASKSEGWELKSIYMDKGEKLVYIFTKGTDKKVYISK